MCYVSQMFLHQDKKQKWTVYLKILIYSFQTIAGLLYILVGIHLQSYMSLLTIGLVSRYQVLYAFQIDTTAFLTNLYQTMEVQLQDIYLITSHSGISASKTVSNLFTLCKELRTYLSRETAVSVKMLAYMVRQIIKCTTLHTNAPNTHSSMEQMVAWSGTQNKMKQRSARPRFRMNMLVVLPFICPLRSSTARTRQFPTVPSTKIRANTEAMIAVSTLLFEEK